jgi:hypothetical protein
VVDIEGGGFAAECVAVDLKAVDFSRKGQVEEGGKEARF